jgi:NitT/TauT family transport system permease protein
MIVQGESNLTTTVVIAGMCVIGIIGACLDGGLRMVEARVTRNWRST